MLGGGFTAGAREGGGFTVHARIPAPGGRPRVSEPIRAPVCDDQVLIRTGLATVIDAQPDLETGISLLDGAEPAEKSNGRTGAVLAYDSG
ncbi:hypothetical protein ADL05_19380 [Nocardiopsis sp. NRRL B-16309]|nr:hypothetical protein ADL05_19380 [Nocardiopsis sp. NRRL B-16309]